MNLTPAEIDAMWNFQDLEGSEARFREAMDNPNQGLETRCELLTQVARTLGLRRRFDEAEATLEEAASSGCQAPRCLIRIALEKGRCRNSSGDREGARPWFQKAWELSVESGQEELEVDAAHMIAIVADPDEALQWNERALETAERSENPLARKWKGSLLNNLGWTYHDLGRFEQAFDLFVRALRFRMESGKEPELGIARWCVGRCLRSLGRFEEALSVQTELAAAHEAAGTRDGFVQEELGELLLALGRPLDARPHFARAHELLSADAWLTEHEPARISRLESLGKTEP